MDPTLLFSESVLSCQPPLPVSCHDATQQRTCFLGNQFVTARRSFIFCDWYARFFAAKCCFQKCDKRYPRNRPTKGPCLPISKYWAHRASVSKTFFRSTTAMFAPRPPPTELVNAPKQQLVVLQQIRSTKASSRRPSALA